MIDAPSSTWFTASPHWHWLIVVHFMLSALAGGTYFLSAMIDLAGRESDRRVARLGYLVTLPLLAVVGVVLIVDLSRPDRFWHLFIGNHTLLPMFKYWVPMSIGTWSVTAFGFFALLSFVAAFAEQRHPDWKFARRLRPPGWLGTLVAVPGAFFALVVTGYTGVMISVLNRPIWSDTPLYGMLFLVSAVTMGAALLVLGARWLDWQSPGVAALQRILVWLLVVQVLVLAAQFIWLGPAARAWLSVWGIVLAIGVVVGILLPMAAGFRRRWLGESGVPAAAAMVLVGGLIVRTAIVFAPDAVAP
jgi:protein NrfD